MNLNFAITTEILHRVMMTGFSIPTFILNNVEKAEQNHRTMTLGM